MPDAAPLIEGAEICIHRVSAQLMRLSPFQILLDGMRLGNVENGRESSFQIAPGNHEIHIKCILARSPILYLDVRQGSRVDIWCQTSRHLLKPFVDRSSAIDISTSKEALPHQNRDANLLVARIVIGILLLLGLLSLVAVHHVHIWLIVILSFAIAILASIPIPSIGRRDKK